MKKQITARLDQWLQALGAILGVALQLTGSLFPKDTIIKIKPQKDLSVYPSGRKFELYYKDGEIFKKSQKYTIDPKDTIVRIGQQDDLSFMNNMIFITNGYYTGTVMIPLLSVFKYRELSLGELPQRTPKGHKISRYEIDIHVQNSGVIVIFYGRLYAPNGAESYCSRERLIEPKYYPFWQYLPEEQEELTRKTIEILPNEIREQLKSKKCCFGARGAQPTEIIDQECEGV
ncbi:hypothetical protein ABLB69_18775 [Xenorhabdus khoisanae]|uniref:hypothetical protein n=1 Tax=Xenorhabdus khoisanae TaxID=880157 RepID=UPI0032B71E8A